ncbi:hypothetical protein ACFE04_011655 [Oxalis oulophora]
MATSQLTAASSISISPRNLFGGLIIPSSTLKLTALLSPGNNNINNKLSLSVSKRCFVVKAAITVTPKTATQVVGSKYAGTELEFNGNNNLSLSVSKRCLVNKATAIITVAPKEGNGKTLFKPMNVL